jgi:hypothetical protein
MGTSPAVDKFALAHSTSPLDLMVLGDYNAGQVDSDLDVSYFLIYGGLLIMYNHYLG